MRPSFVENKGEERKVLTIRSALIQMPLHTNGALYYDLGQLAATFKFQPLSTMPQCTHCAQVI